MKRKQAQSPKTKGVQVLKISSGNTQMITGTGLCKVFHVIFCIFLCFAFLS